MMIKQLKQQANHLFTSFSRQPTERPREHYRFFAASNFIYLAGLLGHASFIPLFLLVDITSLALFNIGSMLLFFTAIRLNLCGSNLKWGYFLALAEVLIHSGLCIIAVGWETGFNYYVVGLVMFIFLFPWKRVRYQLLQIIVTVTLYLGLYQLGTIGDPIRPIAPVYVDLLHLVNSIIIMFTLSVAGYYYSHAARRAEDALELEYQRSEALLHNVLPRSIAHRLKTNRNSTIADYYDCASIMFADIVGFTPLSETMSPNNMVCLLNDIFSQFDQLIDKYRLEKIKTIGDAYMVAAGLPLTREDHAKAIAEMALDMQTTLQQFNQQHKQKFSMRIGIHSGSVVAGVIGQRKFIYDVWGDTVNTASRMESHGEANKIHISHQTQQLLNGAFRVEARGAIEVKGKGVMQTYFLVARNTPS